MRRLEREVPGGAAARSRRPLRRPPTEVVPPQVCTRRLRAKPPRPLPWQRRSRSHSRRRSAEGHRIHRRHRSRRRSRGRCCCSIIANSTSRNVARDISSRFGSWLVSSRSRSSSSSRTSSTSSSNISRLTSRGGVRHRRNAARRTARHRAHPPSATTSSRPAGSAGPGREAAAMNVRAGASGHGPRGGSRRACGRPPGSRRCGPARVSPSTRRPRIRGRRRRR
mmetsp:Transcript_63244/g.181396  ORF Transcript_63244/g.181396 Transcript_63244/m.181396 type:complete len:223 (+) Transcript_63244:785-1453(+)